mmetsp:Transcript_16934/g.25547  ORF Transcript_16934/g.25547 Transcript_16934/m.25547 type:complete len:161 (+) Transcript_16934:160-642(+)
MTKQTPFKYSDYRDIANVRVLYQTLLGLSRLPPRERDAILVFLCDACFHSAEDFDLKSQLESNFSLSLSEGASSDLLSYVMLHMPEKAMSQQHAFLHIEQVCRLLPPQLNHMDAWKTAIRSCETKLQKQKSLLGRFISFSKAILPSKYCIIEFANARRTL